MSDMTGIRILYALLCAFVFFSAAWRMYAGFRRNTMNAGTKDSPTGFWLSMVIHVVVMAVCLDWFYNDYVQLFGRISGFYPEPVIDALTHPIGDFLTGKTRP